MNWWFLQRKLHISWLISIFCFSFVVGVFISSKLSMQNLFLLTASLMILFLCFHYRYTYVVILLVLVGVVIGVYWGSILQTDISNIKEFFGKTVVVIGVVTNDADIDSSGSSKLNLSINQINTQKLSGKIWISTSVAGISKDDIVTLSGKITNGFGGYDGKIYQAKIIKIIKPKSKSYPMIIRDSFVESIKKSIKSEPESSLGIGYLVGQRRQLPADFVLALQAAGLTHVVVASGYNLTILVRLARRLFEKTSKYLSALSSSLMIICFIAITGLSPSMTRAGLVSGLSLLAWYYGRRFHPIVLLSIAMAATVLANPSYVWGDLGWQLSFAAFAGVLILAPLMSRFFFDKSKINFVGQVLIETVAAQIVTAPLIIANFGQFSNVAIIANLLVLPLVPLAMLLTFIAGMFQLFIPVLSNILALPAQWLLHYMVTVINFFAELPWAISNVHFGNFETTICYVLIAAFCVYIWRVTKYNLRDVNIVE